MSHRFEHAHRQAFVVGGQNEDRRLSEKALLLGAVYPSQQFDVLSDIENLGALPDGIQFAISSQENAQIG